MEIILLRHGKPIMPSLKKINASDFIQWVKAYDRADLCPSSTPPNDLIAIAKKTDVVICSSLQRSIYSAERLAVKDIKLKSSEFNEAGMPTANWVSLKMSPNIWAIFFRILWLFGYSKHAESFNEAKLRASKSAKHLINLADAHGRVLFVGHGVYNRLLAKELKSLGWEGPKNPGLGYWGFGIYRHMKI